MKKDKSALGLALHYLSYQDRTKKEMIEYLQKKGCPSEEIDEAVLRLKDYGYINDEDYARHVSDMTQNHPAKGRNTLPRKLGHKGIPEEIIEQTMEDYDESVDTRKALVLANKMMMNALDVPWKKNVDQVGRKLFSRGFSTEVIRTVVRQLEQDETLKSARHAHEEALYLKAISHAGKVLRQRSRKDPDPSKLRQSVMQSLYQQGYESDMIKKVVDEVMHQTDE
jgi:regulatory protein